MWSDRASSDPCVKTGWRGQRGSREAASAAMQGTEAVVLAIPFRPGSGPGPDDAFRCHGSAAFSNLTDSSASFRLW